MIYGYVQIPQWCKAVCAAVCTAAAGYDVVKCKYLKSGCTCTTSSSETYHTSPLRDSSSIQDQPSAKACTTPITYPIHAALQVGKRQSTPFSSTGSRKCIYVCSDIYGCIIIQHNSKQLSMSDAKRGPESSPVLCVLLLLYRRIIHMYI